MNSGSRAIERVTAQAFFGLIPDLCARCRPVIITDLFAESALGQVNDVNGALELLGPERVTYRTRYIDVHADRVWRHIRGARMIQGPGGHEGTFAEYLDLALGDSRYIVTEQATPRKLLADIDLSALGVHTVIGGSPNPYAPVAADVAYSPMFVAGPGNASDLHSDGDGRDVLLYQGFGRKRLCVFPASAGSLLHPVAGYSTVRLAEMTNAERAAFLDYAGGVEAVMEPGETVFMPAYVWHHLDYLETSLSVGFRFGGVADPLAQELIRRVHLDQHTQRIIAGTRDPATAADCREAARAVLAAADRRYPSARAKYRAVRAAAAQHSPVGASASGRRYFSGLIEAEDFLDGALSGFYSRSPEGPGSHDRLWHARERLRDVVRRRARGVAYWA
ncbi:MAG TPA: cupin-like domain-containing protein [Trebonia sp.]